MERIKWGANFALLIFSFSTHICAGTGTHVSKDTCTKHMHTHIHMFTHIHTYKHTYTHTYTHIWHLYTHPSHPPPSLPYRNDPGTHEGLFSFWYIMVIRSHCLSAVQGLSPLLPPRKSVIPPPLNLILIYLLPATESVLDFILKWSSL